MNLIFSASRPFFQQIFVLVLFSALCYSTGNAQSGKADTLKRYYKMVENVITDFGVKPKDCRGEEAGQWGMMQGDSEVWIDIWPSEDEKRAYFMVMSPVIKLEGRDTTALFSELIRANDMLYEVAFCVFEKQVWLKQIRQLEGLDESEIKQTIQRIGGYSADYSEELKNKFIRKKGKKEGKD